MMDYATYEAHGLNEPVPAQMNGRGGKDSLKSVEPFLGDMQYNICSEARKGSELPKGDFHRIRDWDACKTYPGTVRNVSIYSTIGVTDSTEPPAFMFFNDGDGYLWRAGDVRASFVLDYMVEKGELPPTVAVFVNPGAKEDEPDQRSIEYDHITSRFVEFIDSEIVPLVEKHIGRNLSPEPKKRLICGMSSGGICAFNAAWHSPNSFGLVLSHCGSYVNIKGGHNYPSIIRRTARKPIRVFMQSGALDLNIIRGSWPIANQDMAASLEYAGYDYQFVFGEGGHTLRHEGALFAESLRWLFR